jgi:dolichol-phosphate mannosyltransferase
VRLRRSDLLSVVVPVCDEAAGIRAFHARASKALSDIPSADWELIYVDDGSADGSFALLARLAEDDARVRVVKLSRNFGQQIAITAGLDRARGDCAVVIDADLQDPPEAIAQLVAKWRAGFEVVHGVRRMRRGERALKRLSAAAFSRLLARGARIRVPVDAGDFRLVSRRALAELRRLRERDRYLRGLASWIGLSQASVEYERDERYAGDSKYSLRRMAKLALDAITSFTTAPLTLASWLGLASSVGALLVLVALLVQRVQGAAFPLELLLLVALIFVGGVQLVCLGILGAYVGRLFEASKARPLYVVEAELGGEASRVPSQPS